MTKLLPTFLLAIIFLLGCNRTKEGKPLKVTSYPSPAATSSGEPYLMTDDQGNVYLSWIEKNENKSIFKFSTLNNGEWSTPQTIASGENWFVNWADYPMMAANNGKLIAHFLSKSGDGKFAYDVNLTFSEDVGKTWSAPTIVHDDGKEAEHGFVSMLPYNENFLVTWLDGRNTVMEGMEHHDGHHGEMSLRAAIVNPKGEKLKEWQLDNRTCDCCQTTAAMTTNGPVVVYRDRSEEEFRDISIVRLIDSVWTEPKAIYQDNWKIAGCPVNGPRMASKNNTLAIAWFTIPENKSEVKIIFSNDGGETFGQPIQVDEGKSIGRVDLVMLEDKSVVVSWMEGSEIKAARVKADGTKKSSFVIGSSSESRSSGFPQMTTSGTDLIFAWTNSKEKTIDIAKAPLLEN